MEEDQDLPLIITPLDEFLPESELSSFIEWMSENIDWLIVPFKQNAGNRFKKWLEDCEENIRLKKVQEFIFLDISLGYIFGKIKKCLFNLKQIDKT